MPGVARPKSRIRPCPALAATALAAVLGAALPHPALADAGLAPDLTISAEPSAAPLVSDTTAASPFVGADPISTVPATLAPPAPDAEDPAPAPPAACTPPLLASTTPLAYPYVQTGDASWYGADFHGLTTASGETFDALAPTVAHPSLPLGSVVEIKNLENGRTTLARVNDRGPFFKDRIIDCSLAVAHALGFVTQGLTRVQVALVDSLTVVPPFLLGPTVAVAAMSHMPPLQLASALVGGPAARAAAPVVALASLERAVAGDAHAGAAAPRKASVLPFPAIAQAYRHVLRLLMGPYGSFDPAREFRVKLANFGLHDFVRLFTD